MLHPLDSLHPWKLDASQTLPPLKTSYHSPARLLPEARLHIQKESYIRGSCESDLNHIAHHCFYNTIK